MALQENRPSALIASINHLVKCLCVSVSASGVDCPVENGSVFNGFLLLNPFNLKKDLSEKREYSVQGSTLYMHFMAHLTDIC